MSRGRVHIFRDSNGLGEFLEMMPGSIFGEQPFRQAPNNLELTEAMFFTFFLHLFWCKGLVGFYQRRFWLTESDSSHHES